LGEFNFNIRGGFCCPAGILSMPFQP